MIFYLFILITDQNVTSKRLKCYKTDMTETTCPDFPEGDAKCIKTFASKKHKVGIQTNGEGNGHLELPPLGQ